MTEDRLAFYLLDSSPVLFLDIKMLFREQVEGRLETKLNKDIETRYVCVCVCVCVGICTCTHDWNDYMISVE